MAGSPVDAISKAVERSKQLLFPFKAEKWFALGFTVFLAQCGEGGGGGSFQMPNIPSGSTTRGGGGSAVGELEKMISDAMRALHGDLYFYVAIGASIFAFALLLWLVIAWFSSRAKLMFVESVIWDRVDLSSQWTRAGELGWSLFKFRVSVSLGVWVLALACLSAGAIVAYPDIQRGQYFGSQAVIGYAILGFTVFVVALPVGIVFALLDDFVVPLMVVRNVRVLEAWRQCRTEVLSGNIGGVVVFYLLRFVLGIAIGIAMVTITCVTCCITAIPYLGTVAFLPIWVFSRAYPLYYLEQLNIPVFPAPEPTWAAYDQWRFPR